MSKTYILYEGPSMIDGKPIVAIGTGIETKSNNPKTGPMVQTWILRHDLHPWEAVQSGRDFSICGECPLRGDVCYVTIRQGPNMVWQKYRNSEKVYIEDPVSFARGHAIRIGAYGDPTAVPFEIWTDLAEGADMHTGYTHHWKDCVFPLQRLLMASVETEEGAREAWSMGWRTFRVKLPDAPKLPGETPCPASEETGYKLTCHRCGMCSGLIYGQKRNVVINVHGGGRCGYKVKRFEAMQRKAEACAP